jgi:membrane peptidoglycan carboxypeptidase
LILCGLLAGVVVAAATLPAAAVTGLGAKAGSDSFQNLPSELKTPPLPQTTTVLTADGKYLTSFYNENRVQVSLSQVPKVLRDAIISAEDARFYEHSGVDIKGVVRAFVANQRSGKTSQGASTITQQYVRQTLLQQAATPDEIRAAQDATPARKLREMRYAIAVEKKYGKDEILQRYLNISYFGNKAYGAGAASQVYFSKPITQLTLPEAALLAGLVQSPSYYDPVNGNKTAAIERRDYVLRRMADLGYISVAQAATAQKAPIGIKPKKIPRTCQPNGSITKENGLGFYCDWLRIWWAQQPQFGKTVQDRMDLLERGGFTIKLAVDSKVQAAAQNASDSFLDRTSKFASGIVLIEPGTGRVKGMGINRTFGQAPAGATNVAAYTENPLMTGNPAYPKLAGYQEGSTFKMYTMAAALLKGMPLKTTYTVPTTLRVPHPGGGGNCDGDEYYCVKNANSDMAGTHTMWSAFGASVNTYFVRLELAVGVKAAAEAAEKLGLVLSPGADGKNDFASVKADPTRYSFTLGQGSTSWPLYVANTYATIAARGKYCDPTPLSSVTGPDHKPIPAYGAPKCKQVIPAEVADALTDAARCPVGQSAMAGSCRGPHGPTGASVGRGLGRPVAGKTGSILGNASLWFVGFTPQLAGASFVVKPESPTTGSGPSDDATANKLFTRAMRDALDGTPVENFVKPPIGLAQGIDVTVPDVDGDSVESATSTLEEQGFNVQVDPTKVSSHYAYGRVSRTDPRGGSSAPKGGAITIYVSNGNPPKSKKSTSPTPSIGSSLPPGNRNNRNNRSNRNVRPPR